MTVSAAVRWPLIVRTPKAPLRATVARHIFERAVGVIPVRATLPDGRRIGGGDADAPEFQIVRPEAFFARLGRDTKIGVSEAYMDGCLLYTSDAADDLLCVDLGGRRI